MTNVIRQHNRNSQPAKTPDVTPKDPGAMLPPTQGEVGCQVPRSSQGTFSQVHETHGSSQTMTSVAPPESTRQTDGMPANFMDETLKQGVRFSDRRTFAERPAITSRRTSSGTSDSTRGELEHLFDKSAQATARSGRFLRGLAKYIVSPRLEKGEVTVPPLLGLTDNGRPIQMDEFAPKGSLVVTPEKLAAFYTRYRLETEVFPFAELFGSRARDAPERIADISFGLACAYHLTPPPDQPGSRPCISGLTPAGFSRYLTASRLVYPDEKFRRLERIAADGDGPGSGGGAELLPRPLIRCLLPARPDPGARRTFAAAFEDLAHHLSKHPLLSLAMGRCTPPPIASSHSSSPSSCSSPMPGTAVTAVAGPEKRGSAAADARTTATTRSNNWRCAPGALRAIQNEIDVLPTPRTRPKTGGHRRKPLLLLLRLVRTPDDGHEQPPSTPRLHLPPPPPSTPAPPLPCRRRPVGPFACGSAMTRRQQRPRIVQAPRPPERTRGVAAPAVSLSASPYLPAVIVSGQQNRDREREAERKTRRLLSSSSSARCHLHHGGGGGGAERRASTGAERTTTTARCRSDRHGMEMVEEEDYDGGGGGRGPTWDEVAEGADGGAVM
ncbi:hypothetical protein DL767_007417 [Monosporascus sp. MG133]|nr:hypothetical protein DL767_007417 [Monosporascus sp. MG133]